MKRTISCILVISVCLSVLASCGRQKYKKYSVAEAAEKRSVTYADYKQDGYAGFIDKLSVFSAKLTESAARRGGGANVAISPLSVYMALALAVECARGEGRDEILAAVGVSYDEVERFTKYLYAFSNTDFKYQNPMGAKKVLAFSELNNSLWADKGISLNQAGVDKLALDYNCDLFKVNFSNKEARRAIASYIKDKTHGLVDGDVEFNEETIIALINTFYLKEVWNSDGDELRMTAGEYSFARADGRTVSEKFLEGYYFGGKAYDGDGYSAFYTKTNHNFSIKFILPDEGVALSEVFTAANIHAVNSIDDFGTIDHQNKKMHYTRAIFPEYKADYDDDISDILKNDLGIRTIFDENRSDFSGITDTPAYCSKVIHKCSLDVNRKGIEGAAVTIVALDGTSGPLEEYEKVYHDFVVNRAFGFVITDSYGAVLFSGVVNGI